MRFHLCIIVYRKDKTEARNQKSEGMRKIRNLKEPSHESHEWTRRRNASIALFSFVPIRAIRGKAILGVWDFPETRLTTAIFP